MKCEIVTTTMLLGDIEVTIDGRVHYYTDVAYGADVDGNRGVKRTFVDEVTDIAAYDALLGPVALTDKDKDQAANVLTIKFLED